MEAEPDFFFRFSGGVNRNRTWAVRTPSSQLRYTQLSAAKFLRVGLWWQDVPRMGERREAAIEPKTQCLQLWLPPQLALCAGVVVLIFLR